VARIGRSFPSRPHLFPPLTPSAASITLTDTGAGADTGFTVGAGVPLAEAPAAAESLSLAVAAPGADAGAGAETLNPAAAVPLPDTGTAAEASTVAAAVSPAEAGTAADALTTNVPIAVTLTDPDATFGDDSGFAAGLLAADAGTGDDSGFRHGPVIGDAGTADDTALTVTVAAPLAEAGAGDDLPWEYLAALPAAVFPYYAEIPDVALTRVHVGDTFLWLAPS
jgi:hypothetical protein